MSSIDRALERRDAERQTERATEWAIVLRRPGDAAALPLSDGIDAFYNVLQPAFGYYPRVDVSRGNVTFAGDEEGRGVLVDGEAISVGLSKSSVGGRLDHEGVLESELIFKLRSDEPWQAQERWWQLLAGSFERLGYADATLAHWQVIELLKTLRGFGELGALMQYIAVATRHAFDDVAARDGQSSLQINFRPYLDFEAALASITHADAMLHLDLAWNDMTAVPAALARFPHLARLRILDNPLPPSERARVVTLVPAGCEIT